MTWHDTIRRVCREKVRNVHDPVLSLSLFLFHSFRNCPSYIRHRYNTILCTAMLVDADQKWTEQSLRLTSIESYHIISNTVQYNTTQYNLPMTNYRTALYRTAPHHRRLVYLSYHAASPLNMQLLLLLLLLLPRWYVHDVVFTMVFTAFLLRLLHLLRCSMPYYSIPYHTILYHISICIALHSIIPGRLHSTRLYSPRLACLA